MLGLFSTFWLPWIFHTVASFLVLAKLLKMAISPISKLWVFFIIRSFSHSFVPKLNLKKIWAWRIQIKSQVDPVFLFLGPYRTHHKNDHFNLTILLYYRLNKFTKNGHWKSLKRPLCFFRISISTTFQKFVFF